MTRHRYLTPLILLAAVACSETTLPTASDAEALRPAASADRPVVLSATGGAQWIIPDGPLAGYLRRFTFNALRHADGSVSGTWQLVAAATILHGSITCLEPVPGASQPTVRIGGTVDDAKFTTYQAGTDMAWLAVDGGEGGSAVDQTSNLQTFRNAPSGSAAAFCSDGTVPEIPGNPSLVVSPITHGNVQINAR